MKQMGCTEVTPLARLGVFSMSEVAREDNALMNYVFFKSLRLFQRLSILHSTLCVGMIAYLYVARPALRNTS